jgi:aspartate ammonia-lyase
VPTLGYSQATQVAKEALESGRGVYEVVLEKKLMSREQLDLILNPRSMV